MSFAALRNWLTRGRHDPQGPTVPEDLPMSDLPAIPAAITALAASHAATWSSARLAIEEELWGHGFLTPGGGTEILRFANPIGLSAASTLLLLGAGAGGPAQILATDLGAGVTAFEADPDLAEIAARRIQRAGAAMAKRATVARWDRDDPHFRPRMAHHALLLDAIRAAEPAPILSAIASALKPHGQIVVVETVAPTPLDPDDPAIAAWFALEGRSTALPDPDTITRALKRLSFDVRVVDDTSARQMRLAVIGWRHFVRMLARERPSPERAGAVVAQAELWTRRIRMMRWHAVGPGNPAPRLDTSPLPLYSADSHSCPVRALKAAPHESPQQPQVRQGARQELPRGAPPRSRLRDQQEEPPHEGPPRLTSVAGRT